MAEKPEDLIVTDAELRRQLPGLAKELKLGGSGVEQVAGTVTLNASGDPIREYFTTGATSFQANGTATPIGAFTAVVWRRTSAGSWGYQVVQNAWVTPSATPDTVAPVAGTLSVDTTDTTATLTITGASDDRGIQSYEWSRDGGTTWPQSTSEPTFQWTGLTSATAYTWQGRVSDGTHATTTNKITKSTTAGPPQWRVVAADDFTGADGTQLSMRTTSTGAKPWRNGIPAYSKPIIQSNAAIGVGTSWSVALITATTAIGAPVRARCTYTADTSAHVGLFVNMANGLQQWELIRPNAAGIFSETNGVTTAPVPASGTLEVRYTTGDKTIDVYVNGALQITATAATALTGDVGVSFNGTSTGCIDDFQVEVYS